MTVVGTPGFQYTEDSLLSQSFANFKELIATPEIYVPNADENQQSDYSDLPYKQPLQQFHRDLSLRARREWLRWIDANPKVIDELLKEDFKEFKKTAKDKCKKDDNWLDEAIAYEQEQVDRAQFDAVVGIPAPSSYSITPQESLLLHRKSHMETSVARKEYSGGLDNDKFYPSTGIKDDPDFIPPLSISSRNFNLIPPAMRSYNAVYRVEIYDRSPWKDKEKIRRDHSVKPSKVYTHGRDIGYDKDYTDAGGISRDLTLAGHEHHIITQLYCQWEVDVRMTKGSRPDPRSYVKVDNTSVVGQKFLSELNDNPYAMMQEESWDWEDETKVVYFRSYSLFPDHVFWIYMDSSAIGSSYDMKIDTDDEGNVRYDSNGDVVERLVYKTYKRYPHYHWQLEHNCDGMAVAVGCVLTYSDDIHASIPERSFSVLKKCGFIFVETVVDMYGCANSSFVHQFARTDSQLKAIVCSKSETISLTKHKYKNIYIPNDDPTK